MTINAKPVRNAVAAVANAAVASQVRRLNSGATDRRVPHGEVPGMSPTGRLIFAREDTVVMRPTASPPPPAGRRDEKLPRSA
jgi:hypothetical protein